MDATKVMLVDDHLIVRDGIKALLREDSSIDIIGEANSGEDFFSLLESRVPDVVLLDISLPDISGIEISNKLSEEYPQVKKLMLSMYTSEDFIFNALQAGANGYLPKNTTRGELLQAIAEVKEGREYFSKSISDIILKSYVKNAKSRSDDSENKLDTLTRREHELLVMVVEGMSNPCIAEKLSISIRTVETHKTSILRKLDLNSTVDLVKFAIKHNIIEL